ncbi:angiopoietin-1-like [Ylistrum balloti]|uniref:angiopoietin-1-like n=1 Tax=Ylistrum balloti TaxID=509963 RepID=UPI002905997A|nr:angiopoietin-1-like [Ylistrum balloti]
MNLFCDISFFTCIFIIFVASVNGQNVTVKNSTFVLKWQCNLPLSDAPYGVIGSVSLIRCASRCLENNNMCVSFLLNKTSTTDVFCGFHQHSPISPCPNSNVSGFYTLYEKADADSLVQLESTTTLETTTQSVPSTTVTTTQDAPTTTVNPCQNSGTWNGVSCLCPTGCSGKFCQTCYTDCTDGFNDGLTGTAIVTYIQPLNSPTAFKVLCNFDNAVTYIQYRRYGNISFNRDWQSYVDGFGDLEGDFWLGNKYIHLITDQKSYTCGVRLYDNTNVWRFDGYSEFKVDSEVNSFTITYTPFFTASGMSPSDSSKDSRNQPFSTHDRDHTGCATTEQAGWWYNTGCTDGANVNGVMPFDWSSITGVTKTGLGLY